MDTNRFWTVVFKGPREPQPRLQGGRLRVRWLWLANAHRFQSGETHWHDQAVRVAADGKPFAVAGHWNAGNFWVSANWKRWPCFGSYVILLLLTASQHTSDCWRSVSPRAAKCWSWPEQPEPLATLLGKSVRSRAVRLSGLLAPTTSAVGWRRSSASIMSLTTRQLEIWVRHCERSHRKALTVTSTTWAVSWARPSFIRWTPEVGWRAVVRFRRTTPNPRIGQEVHIILYSYKIS